MDVSLITVYMLYMGITLGYMYSFRTELSVYMLFILIASAFFSWTSKQAALILLSAFGSLAVSLPAFGARWEDYKYGLITLGIMTGISFALARVTRANQIHDFLNRQTIERQNQELETERAEAEQARVEATAANQSKSDFLAAMSHEIRTPMNSVLGMTEITLETELSSDQRRHLEMVLDSGKQLLSIIDDILDFSKIEAGKMTLESVDFNLRALLEAAMQSLNSQAEAKGVELILHMGENLEEHYKGDPLRIRQILVNLMNNALKFTDAGSVTLAATCAEPAAALKGAQQISLAVLDTGVGIPFEKRQQIFEQFRQADSSTSRKHGGTGLGLTICQRLISLMEGHLEMDSEVGKGSTFTFSLPLLLSDGINSGSQTIKALSKTGQGYHILVVDDNPMNLEVASLQLARLGCRTETAASGAEALHALAATDFDLVVMDVEMPGMDGIETTQLIRKGGINGDWPDGKTNIPIIAVTAHALVDIKARGLAAGMNDYLTKPLNLARFQQALETLSSGADEADATPLPEPLPEPQAGAVLDLEGARQFLELDPESFQLVLKSALGQLRSSLPQLDTALGLNNYSAMASLAHRITSLARTIGAMATATAAKSLEAATRAEHPENISELYGVLITHAERMLAQAPTFTS